MKSRLAGVPDLLTERKLQGNWNPVDFALEIKNTISSIPQQKKDFPEDSFKLATSAFLSHSRPSLKIQDGCNSNCSYCAIHIARGHSVSLDVQTAIERVQELERQGHGEVVLTTVNIGQYKGAYKDGYCNFSELLALLLANTSKIHFFIGPFFFIN